MRQCNLSMTIAEGRDSDRDAGGRFFPWGHPMVIDLGNDMGRQGVVCNKITAYVHAKFFS